MSLKQVFNKFIGSVLVGMEKSVLAKNLKEREKTVFEWKKLGHVGATGVAEHLQEEHGLEASPTVVGGGEEPNPVFSVSHEKFMHQFQVGESRFHYVRMNGKAEEMHKEFSALSTDFWDEFQRKKSNINKRGKAKKTKKRDDASYEIFLKKQKAKKEAEKKEKEEAKKKAEEAKKETPPPETPPPATPLPETPPPATPLPETPPPATPLLETPPPETPLRRFRRR